MGSQQQHPAIQQRENDHRRHDQRVQNSYQNNAPAVRGVAQDNGPVDFRDVPTDEVLLSLVTTNNWKDLSPAHRLAGMKAKCQALGIDPMTGPFEFIEFKTGTVTLYPTKSCTDQLRMKHGVTVRITESGWDADAKLFFAKAVATDRHGREDEDEAWLDQGGLTPANARMKVITKVKRRVTLSICGLGAIADIADEFDDSSTGVRIHANQATGAIEGGTRKPDANDWRRLHAVGRERGLDHDDLKVIAVNRFELRGTLKTASPALWGRMEAWLLDPATTLEEIERAIGLEPDFDADDAPESRQTHDAYEDVSQVIETETDADSPDADVQDGEFVDDDGVIHGGDPIADPIATLAADLDSFEVVNDGPSEYDNAVADHVVMIDDAQSSADLRRAADSWRLTGYQSDAVTRAADKKKAELKPPSTRPVFGQDLPDGEPGANRHTS